jgi:hypothetical protein
MKRLPMTQKFKRLDANCHLRSQKEAVDYWYAVDLSEKNDKENEVKISRYPTLFFILGCPTYKREVHLRGAAGFGIHFRYIQ